MPFFILLYISVKMREDWGKNFPVHDTQVK